MERLKRDFSELDAAKLRQEDKEQLAARYLWMVRWTTAAASVALGELRHRGGRLPRGLSRRDYLSLSWPPSHNQRPPGTLAPPSDGVCASIDRALSRDHWVNWVDRRRWPRKSATSAAS